MTILLKETVQTIAQSIGINNLPEEVAEALAPDVEYRMREIMQGAIKCMLHSKRTTLTTEDVNSALQLHNIEPLYGFASGGPLQFKRAVGQSDLFYVDDAEIDFKELMDAPLPKAPLDTAVVIHWLAIEGVQPAIPENVPLEAFTPSVELKKIDTLLSKKKDDEFGVEVKLPVKHVLSQELQVYFEKITGLIISRANPSLIKAALDSLATDSGLHPLVPYFTQFIADEVVRNLDDIDLLFSLMRVVRSLLINPHIHIDPYLHQLMPSVITCLVAKRLGRKSAENSAPGRKFIDNHWDLRDYVANLISFICRRFGRVYHNLQPRITKTLLQAFLDPKRAMTQHYGAIKGLAALGPRVVGLTVLPNVETFLKHLAPDLSMEAQRSEMKRNEAMRVYGTLLTAIGVCMTSRLKYFPVFFLPRTWNPGGQGKIVTARRTVVSNSLSDSCTVSQLTNTSPRKTTTSADAQDSQPMEIECIGHSYHSSMSTIELPSQDVKSDAKIVVDVSGMDHSQHQSQDMARSREQVEPSDSDKAIFPLSDSWKEDVTLGPLFSSLIDLFGEALLPFVPRTELNIFL
ncbi:hypothetical protein KP509_16G031600 [Ceratopteris richardii]|uniref:TATA box binding protein associated factor (TAF) histone-like fold domain-containing protein n=1 Tax=Ceratopteris richardii TaxID=49495 RepID=A0A8T2T228_CERRI|nr:hypothetical protein KP509_16G031600 [Ceratopteris richardii]